jgi:hypothetical protein
MRALLWSLVFCTGCWDFASLSSGLGADLASADLASADLASADLAGTDGASIDSGGCPPGFACEGFEGGPGSIPPSPWSIDVPGGGGDTAMIVGVHHSGSYSLELQTNGASENEYAYLDYDPLPPGTIYLRFWVLAQQSPLETLYVIFNAFTAGSPPTATTIANVGGNVSKDWALDIPDVSAEVTIVDEWTCVAFSVSPNQATLQVGAAAAAVQSQVAAWIGPASILIGIARGIPGMSTTAYIDDVVLSSTPLSCD